MILLELMKYDSSSYVTHIALLLGETAMNRYLAALAIGIGLMAHSPRSERRAPRTGVTDAVCWPRSSLGWRGQGCWAGVLAPWAMVGGWRLIITLF